MLGLTEMKINAVAVTSKNFEITKQFYSLLGFVFSDTAEEDHVEPSTPDGSARLMIDSTELSQKLLGEGPKPGNHSGFAIEYDAPEEIDSIVEKVASAGFAVVKEPWDAFWGQRYAVVEDPDGYKVDLYAYLSK